MKTIEERAQEYANQYRRDAHDLKGERADAAFAAYCQGVEDERKEMTRWHDPKEELPTDDACVICKVDACEFIDHLVLNWHKSIWWTYAAGVLDDEGWHVFSGIVVGWRPIYE